MVIIIAVITHQRVRQPGHQRVRQPEHQRVRQPELRPVRLPGHQPDRQPELLHRHVNLHHHLLVSQPDLPRLHVNHQTILPNNPDHLQQGHHAPGVAEVMVVAEVIAVAAPEVAEVTVVEVPEVVAVAEAEDDNSAYCLGISEALISLKHTYLPSLFTNKTI
jgi:hypothetical protein